MRAMIACVHYYLKQAVTCMLLAGTGEDEMHKHIYELMDYVKTFDRFASL